MREWFFDPLPLFGFDLGMIDVPADFENYSAKGEAKGPRAQYATMSDAEIAALPVGQLFGPNAWLFHWATAPKLDKAIDCMRAWGFRYVSHVSWNKIFASGKPAIGTGYVVRSQHEICLIGAIGNPEYRSALPSIFNGIRREHSRKPDELYRLIDDRFAPEHYRRVDLFSRETRPGWISWGREAGKFDNERGAA